MGVTCNFLFFRVFFQKRCAHAGHDFTSKKLALEMAEHEHAAERGLTSSSSVDEIGEAISVCSLSSILQQDSLLVLISFVF